MNSNNSQTLAEFQEKQLERLESGFVLCRDLMGVVKFDEAADLEGFYVIPSSGNSVIGRYRTLKDMENSAPNVIVRRTVYKMLCDADKALKRKSGFETCQIVVTYGYRSPEIQESLYRARYAEKKQQHPDFTEEQLIETTHIEIAFPEVAGHPTGGAVDVTIYDYKKGKFLDFGTEICQFNTKNIYYASDSISQIAKKNRRVLRSVMCQQGFAPYDGEWWHFSYGDREWAFYTYRRELRSESISKEPIALYRQKDISSISEIAYNDKYRTHVSSSSESTAVRLAIQKEGRLTDETITLLKKSGISISLDKRGYLAKANNFPVEIILVRDDDIPNLVESGVADIGIVGENVYRERVYREKGCKSVIKRYLGFGKCFLALAVPKESDIKTLKDLSGRRIATSYKRLAKQFLKEKGITDAKIIDIAGSVEVAPVIHYADAIIDLVSTGSSLRQNNLEVFYNILNSQSVFIANTLSDRDASKHHIIEQLLERIDCYLVAKKYKRVSLICPIDSISQTVKLLCCAEKKRMLDDTSIEYKEIGIDSYGVSTPVIYNIWGTDDFVQINTVVEFSKIWELTEQLKQLGARNVVLSEIEGVIKL